MDHIDIKGALQRLELTQTLLARELGVAPSTVCMVIHRVARSGLVEEAIAKLLKRPLHEVWPGWYSPSGLRIPRRRSNAEALTQLREIAKQAKAA